MLYVQHVLNSMWDWCQVEHNARHKQMLLTTSFASFFFPFPMPQQLPFVMCGCAEMHKSSVTSEFHTLLSVLLW